jgi:hypothetical protein
MVVDTALRTPLLRHLLATQGWRKVLVFVATQHASEHVADKLRQSGVAAAALHGQLSTGRRAEVLHDLQPANCRCWWPPTWPRAASTCRAGRGGQPRPAALGRGPHCTASAAPAVPAPAVWP